MPYHQLGNIGKTIGTATEVIRAEQISGGLFYGQEFIVGGGTQGIIRSADYVPGVSGWAIFGNGSAEFNNVTVRGDIVSGNWDGAEPANLASAPDSAATQGFYLDSSAGAGQFAGPLYVGRADRAFMTLETDTNSMRLIFTSVSGLSESQIQHAGSAGLSIATHGGVAIAMGTDGDEGQVFLIADSSVGANILFAVDLNGGVVCQAPLTIEPGAANDLSIKSSGDVDTGFFWPGSDDLGVAVQGIEIARFSDTPGHNLQRLDWSTWTPTITNVTVGTGGSTYGQYVVIGQVVFYRWGFKLGTSGFSVSGLIRASFPAGAAPSAVPEGDPPIGQAWITDVSATQWYPCTIVHDVNNAGMRVWLHVSSGTYASYADTSSTAPITWAAEDELAVTGWYRLN